MSEFQILLLGPLEFKYEDEIISIKRRMIRALIAYLGYQQNLISRADLILLFWPDIPESQAKKRLRETLSKLRKELPDPEMLITVDDKVGFDREKVYVDVHEFEIIYENVTRTSYQISMKSQLPESIHQDMINASNLWRSPRFMAGFEIPDSEGLDYWFSEMKNVLENSRVTLLERLADHEADSGDLERAVFHIRKALSVYDANDANHIRLMKWLFELDRHDEVINHKNYLEKMYHQDGFHSLPEGIQEVFETLLNSPKSAGVDESILWPDSSFIRVSFVNREDEMNELRRAFQHGGIVSVRGESGIGKTRLVYEFFQNTLPVPRFLFSPSRVKENQFSLQTLIDLLRYSILQQEWKELDSVWVKYLFDLLPELNLIYPELSPPGKLLGANSKMLIFESIYQLFLNLAKKDRILFFIDDAQWVDKDTLEFLSYLIEKKFFLKYGLLVLTSDNVHNNQQFENFLERFSLLNDEFFEIRLEEMRKEDVALLVQHIFGQSWGIKKIEHLISKTGGNPLFIIESLRALLEFSSGTDYSEILDYLPTSGTIQMFVRQRLNRLSLNTHQTLSVAALFDRTFTPEILEAVSGKELFEIVQHLEEAERMNLVRPSLKNDSIGEYVFAYDKIREVLLLDLSQARKRVLHFQIARGLVSLGMDDAKNALQIANHYQISGKYKQAFEYWVKAGMYFRGFYAVRDVNQAFQKAEKLFKKIPEQISDEEAAKLYQGWGDFLDDYGDPERALQIFSILERIGKKRKSAILIGTALSGKGRSLRRKNRFEEALECNLKAIEFLEQSSNQYELGCGYNRLAIVLAQLGEYDRSSEVFQRSIDLVSDCPDLQDPLANTLLQIARIYNYRGRPLKAIALAERSSERYKSLFNVLYNSINQLTCSNAQYLMGNFKKADQLNQQVMQDIEGMNIWRVEVMALVQQGQIDLFLGRLDSSFRCIQRAEEMIEKSGEEVFLGRLNCVKGNIYRMLTFFDKAVDAHHSGIQHSNETYYLLDNQVRMGMAQLFSGDTEQGKEILTHVMREACESKFDYLSLPVEMVLTRLLTDNGQYEEARDALLKIVDQSREHKLNTVVYNCYMFLSENALLWGKFAEAEKYADKMIKFGEQSCFIWIYLRGLRLKIVSRSEMGLEYAPLEKELEEKFEFLRERTKNPELRPGLENYFVRISNRLPK